MEIKKNRASETRQTRRWWPVPLLVGLGLVLAVVAASASTAAPQANSLVRERLSDGAMFAAFPDVAVGSGGLIVAVWTEGDPNDPTTERHVGPLKLGWVSDGTAGWQTVTVDSGNVYDVAVAVSGSTAHIIWSRDRNAIRYKSCTPSQCDYRDTGPEGVAAAQKEALQVDIVVDDNGTPHLAWVEDDNKVYYTRKQGQGWMSKAAVANSDDSEGPALAYANGFVHLVWTEWMNVEHTASEIKYCQRGVSATSWSLCFDPLVSWVSDHLARNLSIAADGSGNVYVTWDQIQAIDAGTTADYTIAYKHSYDSGEAWRVHQTFGTYESGEGEGRAEYVRFLRPRVTLAVSGTQTVPLLGWHARPAGGGGGEPELAQASAGSAYKALWTYATRPGSNDSPDPGENGKIAWVTEPYTVTTDHCGEVDMNVDSATVSLVAVGDLNDILAGAPSSGDDHLHAVYHEQIGSGMWGIFYNNHGNTSAACLYNYLPVIMRNASGGSEGE